MKKYSVLLLLLLVSLPSLYATTANREQQTTIARFDKDLLDYIDHSTTAKAKKLTDTYPALLPALAQTISNTTKQNEILPTLKEYFSHPALKSIYKQTVEQYNDLTVYEIELELMSENAKKELGILAFPQWTVHVSGFKENTIYINNQISLSLDKYLGSNHPAYKGYFRIHQLQQMQPKMIVRDFTKAWLMADVVKTETTNGDLLAEMVEAGKLLYTLSVLLPNYTESDLIGYTELENNWCNSNHKKIWETIVKQNHLYTTDRHIISLYFDETLSAKAPIKGSPVEIGRWIGFQIVKQYASNNKKSLRSVINTDARTILKDAKYRQ